MAQFTVGSLNSIKDSSVRKYLQELNENLTYMFNNLTPEDNNASGVPKLTVVNDGTSEARIEVTADGFRMFVGDVNADNLVETINTQLLVTGNAISITSGHLIVDTNGFKLDATGNAQFAGNITAGGLNNQSGTMTLKDASGNTFGLWNNSTIKMGAFEISFDNNNNCVMDLGHGNITKFANSSQLYLSGNAHGYDSTLINGGDVDCYDITINAYSHADTLSSILSDFEDRISALEEQL